VTSLSPDDDYQSARGERALRQLAVIEPDDAKQAVASKVPAFRDVRKTEYLVLRSVHFSHPESLAILSLNEETYIGWLEKDTMFADWSLGKNLRDLQTRVGEGVLRSRFLRNVFLVSHIDSQLLSKRFFNPGSMSDDERKEAVEAMKRYSAPNIASMLKILDHEDMGEAGQRPTVTFQITLEPDQVLSVEHKRAAAAALLQQFTKDPGIIEGEAVMVSEDEE
jgi:hypothetical protein